MHGLLRCNINMGVHVRARSVRITQRCHNSPRWEKGLQSANDVMHWKRAEDWRNLKKVSRVETYLGRRRLAFAYSRRPWAGVTRNGWGGVEMKKPE